MLRALLIRQAFLVLDLLLVVVVAFVAFQVVTTFLSRPGNQVGLTTGEADPQEYEVAAIPAREAYQPIIGSGLFGSAAQTRQDEAPPATAPPPPPSDDEVSNLPLRLWGTVSMEDPESPLATAVIEQTRGGSKGRMVYYVGSTIVEDVELKEIHYKRVRLFNPSQNRYEWLVRDEKSPLPLPTRRSAVPAPVELSGPNVTVNTSELAERMSTEGPEIYAQMLPSLRVATDEDGNELGLTADGIGDVALAQELGFEEGDILQQINGRPVTNPQHLMGLMTQFQGVDTFRVSVLRNGSPQMLTISLR